MNQKDNTIDIFIIKNLRNFLLSLKKESLYFFVFIFQDIDEKEISPNIITLEEIQWLFQKHFELYNGRLAIQKNKIEMGLTDIHKYITYKILNKQVDKGILELCWDKRKKNFFWRQVKKYE